MTASLSPSLIDPLGLTITVKVASGCGCGQADADKAWKDARAYLVQDPGMKNIIEFFEDPNRQVDIVVNDSQDTSNPRNTYTVNWDPHTALRFVNPDGSVGFRSPALSLGHELGHAFQYATEPGGYTIRINTAVPNYDNMLEEQVILKYENTAAKSLREDLRYTHRANPGALYYVSAPTHR